MFSTILSLEEEEEEEEEEGGGGGIHILVHISKNANSHPHNHQAGIGQDSAKAENAAPMPPLPHTLSLNGATLPSLLTIPDQRHSI
jgi:hypothetical protein